MALPELPTDTRRYRELLNEALARIPVHNPEWTNFNDVDPGVTLLQLFAFMSESIIYRTNRIPERNRRKFLRLLGVPLRAAQAARGLVVFANPRGKLQMVELNRNRELFAGKTPFRTRSALQVLPIEARAYYKSPLSPTRAAAVTTLYRRLYASFETETQELAFYETKPLETPANGAALPLLDLSDPLATVDGALWLALLARPGETPDAVRPVIADKILTLGILPAPGEDGCVLPPGDAFTARGPGLRFDRPNTRTNVARYEPLSARPDDDLLTRPGLVELSLPGQHELTYWSNLEPLVAGTGNYPPSLEETGDQQRLITWIRIRGPEATSGLQASSRQLRIGLSWIGINAARVIQRADVTAERLPEGNGEPNQSATLGNTPVLPDSVRLFVDGEPWEQVDDLAVADPEVPARGQRFAASPTLPRVKVYTVDRASGEILFGDGIHGMRPASGAVIQASYAYGGGPEGMVGIGSIDKGPDLPDGIKVANPVPTYGGDHAETVAEAERRIPQVLRHRNRLVSADDFREIARNTPGVELGRVDVLPLVHPQQPSQLSSGVVTVVVVPRNDPLQPEAPRPDRLFLETVCEYLAPRRIVTTELHVRGPDYHDLWVALGIEVIPGREQGPVRDAAEQAIRGFLSPLTGGFEGKGWPLGKAVEAAELFAAATRVPGVAKVTVLRLGGADSVATERVTLNVLGLPRLRAVAVTVAADPPTLSALRGEATEPPPGAGERPVVPVPVVPPEC